MTRWQALNIVAYHTAWVAAVLGIMLPYPVTFLLEILGNGVPLRVLVIILMVATMWTALNVADYRAGQRFGDDADDAFEILFFGRR